MNAYDRIIVALDVKSLSEAESLVKELAPYVGCFKIGLELITSIGAPQAIKFVHDLEGEVFLDGKFNDIPNTVGKAALAASSHGVALFNVHAASGVEAMKAAVQNKGKSRVLAVTVLTSIDDEGSKSIFGASSKEKVLQFAQEAKAAGMDGIICSPEELELLGKLSSLAGLLKVTPGVRPKWAPANDQKRVMTPGDAIAADADMLVIGRPITNPPKEIGKPADAAQLIAEEIRIALKRKSAPM